MGENDNYVVKIEFLKMMNSLEMFFSNGLIFFYEFDKDVFMFCSFVEKVKEYCLWCW